MIEIVAGWDSTQIQGIMELHMLWAREDHGIEMDTDLWLRQYTGYCQAASWIPLVAWDEYRPVGCAAFLFHHSALDGKKYIYGDQAYFLPEYRSKGNFSTLLSAAHSLLPLMDVDVIMAPTGADSGPKAVYAAMGFKPYSTLLRLEVR